jgi:hypothetical protein
MARAKQRLWKRRDQFEHELPGHNWQPSQPQPAVPADAAPSWSPGGELLLSQEPTDRASLAAVRSRSGPSFRQYDPPQNAEGQIDVNMAAIRGTHPKKGQTNG